jgi:hypothetical protein
LLGHVFECSNADASSRGRSRSVNHRESPRCALDELPRAVSAVTTPTVVSSS